MTRHNAMVGVLAAAGVGTLAWFAWKIVSVQLPLGASVAAWLLWVIVAAAVATFVAYARELVRHETALRRGASWKPLPGLALLWIAGLTAAVAFGFMLPDAPASAGRSAEEAGKASTALTSTTPTASPTTSASTPAASTTSAPTTRQPSARPASRSVPRTPPTSFSSSGSPALSTTSPAPVSRTSSSAPTPPPTSSTTSPLLDIHILPTQAKRTTPPGQ